MPALIDSGFVNLDRFTAGDGTTVDTTGFGNAISAAITLGRPLAAKRGRTYLVDATLTFPAGLELHLHGSTIKKAASLTTYAAQVTGDGVELRGGRNANGNGGINGNRTGGATGNGILIRGKVAAYDFDSSHNTGPGWRCDASAGELDGWRCSATDNDDGLQAAGTSAADGFYCQTNGRMRLRDFYAYGNARSGAYFQTSANDKCYVDGRSYANGRAGVTVRCTKQGRIGILHGDDNWAWAVEFAGGVYRWEAAKIQGDNGGQNLSGLWTVNTGGTTVGFFDARGCKVGLVTGTGCRGYGIDFYKDAGTGNPAYENSIGHAVIDHMGLGDRDPALTILGGAHDNHIGRHEAWGSTFALSMGEPPGYTPATNVNNTIDELFAYQCDWGVARFDQAQYTRIGTAISRGCHHGDPAWPALFNFTSSSCSFNTVKKFYHTPAATKPTYLIYSDSAAHDNWVAGEDPQAGYVTARISDAGTNNHFTAVAND